MISFKLYIDEFTVFINVNIPNLKATSILIFDKVKKDEIRDNDITNTNTDKKYLYRSDCSTEISEKVNLFIYTCLGFVWDKSSLIENLINDYNFKNLIPELVEKKDPPITTNNRKIKYKLSGVLFIDIPIFEILLTNEKNIDMKS
mgnify:CR=1 FL=1